MAEIRSLTQLDELVESLSGQVTSINIASEKQVSKNDIITIYQNSNRLACGHIHQVKSVNWHYSIKDMFYELGLLGCIAKLSQLTRHYSDHVEDNPHAQMFAFMGHDLPRTLSEAEKQYRDDLYENLIGAINKYAKAVQRPMTKCISLELPSGDNYYPRSSLMETGYLNEVCSAKSLKDALVDLFYLNHECESDGPLVAFIKTEQGDGYRFWVGNNVLQYTLLANEDIDESLAFISASIEKIRDEKRFESKDYSEEMKLIGFESEEFKNLIAYSSGLINSAHSHLFS